MSVGRRAPKKPPPLWSLLNRDPKRAGALLEKYLLKLGVGAYLGLPAPHSHEDDDSGGVLDQAETLAWIAFQRSDEGGC